MKHSMMTAMLLALGGLAAVSVNAHGAPKGGVEKGDFGKLSDGTPVDAYTLTNANGLKAKIITFGAILTELHVPDKSGNLGDVVLGFDNIEQYEKGHPFFGATVGRVANRIAKGKFTLDGKEYTLAINNGPNHLHGGLKGFDKKVWKAEPVKNGDGPSVKFSTNSPDGEEGYPGNLTVSVTYTLTNKNALRIEYTATTDQDTPVNLTNHSYFNLSGKDDILNHSMRLNADRFVPVDSTLIPTGELKAVKGTPMDFTAPRLIGERIEQTGGDPTGYDHCYVINHGGKSLTLAAHVTEPTTGRVMEVFTTEPGVQFYTGNFLDGTLTGKGGWTYQKHAAFCLEAGHFPDAVNQPKFPSIILHPGSTYHQRTEYVFSAQ